MIAVYKITNRKTGKIYVGRSKDVFERLKTHCFLLKNKSHQNKSLQEDFSGISDLSFEILEFCHFSGLKRREEYWIKKLDAVNQGYNIVETDEECGFNNFLDPAISSYLKKALTNIDQEIRQPVIKMIDENNLEFLLNLFDGDINLIRAKNEILIVPSKFENLRKPPFVYLDKDFY